jgi:hypothetical protein
MQTGLPLEISPKLPESEMRVEAGEEDLTTAEQFYSVAA